MERAGSYQRSSHEVWNYLKRSPAMSKKILLAGMVFFFMLLGIPGIGATVETERLIFRDITENMLPERLKKLVSRVDSTLTEVLKFWAADPKIKEFGKIIVEFDHPLRGNVAASFVVYRKESGKEVRVVKVFGGNEYPHQLAHKLTSAIFRHPDMLVRNMMGEASEMRFGNPLSFPACGFNKDEWVMALMQAGSFVPLAEMGTEQSDWGKEIVDEVPTVKERVKQHTYYLEAGSFGEFLIDTYGIEKMKQFYRLSRNKSRPWKEVFGSTLEQLEAKWLEAIKLGSRDKMGNISVLTKLWKKDPVNACYSAQDLVEGKR
jgi:hypothetical protein